MSDLLSTPEMEALKRSGMLIDDASVFDLLLRELLKPEYETGAIIDGFARTETQVHLTRLLRERMLAMRSKYDDAGLAYPRYKVCCCLCGGVGGGVGGRV